MLWASRRVHDLSRYRDLGVHAGKIGICNEETLLVNMLFGCALQDGGRPVPVHIEELPHHMNARVRVRMADYS